MKAEIAKLAQGGRTKSRIARD